MGKKTLCGVDLGGTKLAVGLVSSGDGEIVDKIIRYDHTGLPEKETIKMIADTIRDLLSNNNLSEDDLIGIGVGFAGHININTGECITTSNLEGFDNFPIKSELGRYFKVPVVIDNDANAQACGEHLFGAGKGVSDLLFVTISTGIGAGIYVNNKLVHGVTGTAGEIGHTIMNPDSDALCTCGNYGCVMAEASGLGLPYQYVKQLKKLRENTGGEVPDVTDWKEVDGLFLVKQIEEGDPVALAVMKHSARYVGLLLYNMFQTFNPALIIMGGGLMNIGDIYLDRIKEHFYNHAGKMMVEKTPVVYESLGKYTGMIGAASLVVD